jgi:hypothetical protein
VGVANQMKLLLPVIMLIAVLFCMLQNQRQVQLRARSQTNAATP